MVPARTMKWMVSMAALLLTVAACAREAQVPTAPPASSQQEAAKAYAREQYLWRAKRIIDLNRPDGWTSLVGLHWLDPGVHRIGSDPDNGIRLAMGPAHLGVFTVRDGKASFVADTEVTVDGQPSRGGALRSDTSPAGASAIGFDGGNGLATVIERGGRLALRVKHAEAETRRNFAGLDYWLGGMAWQVPARFVAHPPGKTLPVLDVLGNTQQIANPGVLEFELGGKLLRLEALDEGEGTLFIVFADRTSGHGSYPAGRFIDAPMPDKQGRVVIDFNQAYNPPCAFTPFATCPLAPPENRLDVAVEAGEKIYAKYADAGAGAAP